MGLTKKQEDLYRQTMEEAKSQLDTIDEEMEKEIQKARERLAKLQESKESFRQLYEGAARLLGVEIESEEESDEDKQSQEVTAKENEEKEESDS
ncbi:MAG: hypothetical protein J7L72_08275 [Candidatus Aminicenantes bacterium]|nr:hypothetical protein [Candidatus Aminicenantes bacterium]HHF51168.1 hypothetical protein [Candidatus Aminicenantes bacterium]